MDPPGNGARLPRQINLGVGLNDSEKLLAKLGEQSFLRFWSHANTFESPGVEHSDLLVVCGDNVILFSDKRIAFNSDIAPIVAWRRWYKRAVSDSAKQLHGAAKVVRRDTPVIFKDAKCEIELGIPIPPASRIRLYKVAVTSLSREDVVTRSISPFLSFESRLSGNDHVSDNAAPFTIGDVNPDRDFVHVMDDAGLRVVLTTLDTVTDFARYLDARQKFLRDGDTNAAESELGMLARYLLSFDDEGVPQSIDHNAPGATSLTNAEWESKKFIEMLALRETANTESYVWDMLIENHATMFENGTYEYSTYTELPEAERVVRQMALESRLNRRLLSRAWIEACLRDNPVYGATLRTVPHSQLDSTSYLFLNIRRIGNTTYEEYRHKRRQLLMSFMLASLIDVPTSKVIVGLAASVGEMPDSYDLAHFSVEEDANQDTLQKDAQEAWNNKKKYFSSLGAFKVDERDIPNF